MPPRKKSKISHPAKSNQVSSAVASSLPGLTRRRGLCDLPTEILQMVAQDVDPVDLYNMSRTCRDLRAVLWTRQAALVWKEVMSYAWLPVQPPFMSTGAFVHLLFSTYCYICGRSMRTILNPFLVRVCKKCIPRAFVWYSKAAEQVRSINSDLSDAILHPTTFSKHFVVYDPTHDKNDESRNLVLQSHVDSVLKQYKDLGTPVSEKDMRTFTSKLKTDCGNRPNYSRAINYWLDGMRKREVKDGKERRFADIQARLRREGWGRELDYMGHSEVFQMSRLPFVRQSGRLTDAEWPKVMSVLQDRLNWARVYRTQDEYRNVIRARLEVLEAAIVAHCDQLPQTSGATCPPAPIDFAYTPQCRTILDLPLSETVTADHFAAIVPNLVERWNTDVKKQLTLYLRRYIRRIPANVDPLALAIAVFTCSDCSASSWYTAILDHQCLRQAPAKLPSAEDDLYSRVVMQPTEGAEWLARFANEEDLIVSDVPFDANRLEEGPAAGAAIEIMRRIVLALGLDAKRATIDELKACGGWLRCTQCEPGGSEELVKRTYDWAAAFEHAHKHFVEAPKKNKAKVQDIWQRVDHPEVLATVQSLKAHKDLSSEQAWWCCSSCPDFDADTPVMKAHLSTQHDIQDIHQAVCDGTIYSHPSKARNEGYCIEIPLFMRTYGPGSDSESGSDDGDLP